MRWLLLALFACSAQPTVHVPPHAQPPNIELVESQPVETTLDSELRDADKVWLEMINGAETSLDFAEFYASNAPQSRLEPIVQAILRVNERGKRVRFLADITFVREYHDTIDRFQKAGVEIRMLDLSTSTGGILHAKYFIVDGRDAFLGSQNFDWRALEHIEELGARIREPAIVSGLGAIFEADWARAGNEPMRATKPIDARANGVELVASPRDLLPAGVRWDLPRLVDLIERARTNIRVQLLTYKADDWTELEAPLLAAAARGVRVELLVADWSKREKTLGGLRKLARVPNVEVRFVTIPEHSSGFIPFARVIHAKLLVIDGGTNAWIGTSNWERDYFYGSRNVGLVIDHAGIAGRIQRFSDATWNSSYATRVEPDREYPPPRIK